MDVAAPAKSPTVSPANLVEYSRTHTATVWSSSGIVRNFKDEWQALGFRVRGSSFSRASWCSVIASCLYRNHQERRQRSNGNGRTPAGCVPAYEACFIEQFVTRIAAELASSLHRWAFTAITMSQSSSPEISRGINQNAD